MVEQPETAFSKHSFDRVFFFQDSNSLPAKWPFLAYGKSLFSELTASVFASLGKYRADLERLSLSPSLSLFFFLFLAELVCRRYVCFARWNTRDPVKWVRRTHNGKDVSYIRADKSGLYSIRYSVPFYIRRYLITPFLRLTKCNLTLVLSTSVP